MLFFSKVGILLTMLYLIYAVICWGTLTYYITMDGPVVKQGHKYYMIRLKDIRMDEYKVYVTISDRIFNSRTFEFTRSYMRSTKKDGWKDVARFWGIKEHQKVAGIISKCLNHKS